LLIGAPVLMVIGFEHHLGRRAPLAALSALIVAQTLALAVFHYVVDAMAVRIALTSLFHGTVCAVLVCGLRRGAHPGAAAPAGMPYPARFAFWSALILTVAYFLRGVLYAAHSHTDVTIFDPSGLNLAFVALGTLAMPGLTLGAVMMANAGLIGKATYAAEHDYLTGAWSRRAFFGQAGDARTRALRNGAALAVLVFDVDHFKTINDTHGHPVGDLVLVDIVLRTAAALQSAAPRGAACARMGGEEFAVLLPDTGTDAALRIGDLVRTTLARACVAVPGRDVVCYTISVGVAGLSAGETLSSLLQRADAALYAAKRAGRNRVWDARLDAAHAQPA
jgi:diguanylate cyclase (GGDEF)-like protein